MDKAALKLTPHERGAEMDLVVMGMTLPERLWALSAAVVALFSGRIKVHLCHAQVDPKNGTNE